MFFPLHRAPATQELSKTFIIDAGSIVYDFEAEGYIKKMIYVFQNSKLFKLDARPQSFVMMLFLAKWSPRDRENSQMSSLPGNDILIIFHNMILSKSIFFN